MKTLSDLKNPTEWFQLSLEFVSYYRLMNCPYYSECLNFAALKQWTGFRCSECLLKTLQEKGTKND